METKFGVRWGISYALVMPKKPVCGFILNPDADKIYELQFCNQPAIYGFHFKSNDPLDLGTRLGAWQGVCAEHTLIVREQDLVAEIWLLKAKV